MATRLVKSCHGCHHRQCWANRRPEAAARRAGLQAGSAAGAERGRREARDRAPRDPDALGETRSKTRGRDRPADAGAHVRARARDAGTDSPVSPGIGGETPDSSVIVAAFASWNPHHEAALQALGDSRDLVTHAELESYSVLTRLPEPMRAEP